MDFRIVVCDNFSEDDSLTRIKTWAEGNFVIKEELIPPLNSLIHPPVKKPIPYVEYSIEEALQGGQDKDNTVPLILIQNGSNKGFSAGNNVGIQYALKKGADYIWVLNNDTVVDRNTLGDLVTLMDSDQRIGISGTTLYFLSEPGKIQTIGGGKIKSVIGLDRFSTSSTNIDYISGTSLFVRRELFEQVGLLDEGFFFYWEDVDFSHRAKKLDWKLAVATNASVYHKFSSTVGKQSLQSDLYKVFSLTRYFKKHHRRGWMLPVFFNISGMIFKRFWRGQFNRFFPIFKEFLRAVKS
jgi:GT2 family glycosyltransferase